ncbi:MAG: hypothetical protein ACFFC5_04385 [Promethearchaeota archaeon]
MVETRTLSTLLVILVGITSLIMMAVLGRSWYLDPSELAFPISFFLVQIELILITILLLRFRSSIEEIESES